MPRFRVIHKISKETWEVDSSSIEEASKVVGWPNDVCRILGLMRGPYAEIIPPRIAVQVTPPNRGSCVICPYCNFTMVEVKEKDFWWRCSSCDRLYHEWDNEFYDDMEI